MKKRNPWLDVPYTDYEAHMSHPQVQQLQQLDLIIAEKMAGYQPKSVAVLGACSGNGFGHFSSCERIYAIDINAGYLQICKTRFAHYGNALVIVVADINQEDLPIPHSTIDLVICHLFLEYTDIAKTAQAIRKMLKPGGVVNIVLQESGNLKFVSDTAISSLTPLSGIASHINEKALLDVFNLTVIAYKEYNLPNGKLFKSYDLQG